MEVTSEIGFALWQIQILESTVGVYLVLVHKADPSIARIEVEAMFDRVNKNTLGQLLRAIQSTQNAPQKIVDRLERFVEKRNWLVHHSRHESHDYMYSETKRLVLVQKISAIADDALALMKEFQAATEAHLMTTGLTKEQIDSDAAKILNQWINSA